MWVKWVNGVGNVGVLFSWWGIGIGFGVVRWVSWEFGAFIFESVSKKTTHMDPGISRLFLPFLVPLLVQKIQIFWRSCI